MARAATGASSSSTSRTASSTTRERRGPLQLIHAAYDEDAARLTLRFPDGTTVDGETVAGEELTTSFHRRPRAARRVEGPWDEALSETAGESLRLVAADVGADRGRGGAATLLGEASLGAIAGVLGVDAGRSPPLPHELRDRRHRGARRGRLDRPADPGRRRGRRAPGQRRSLRDHDPEPRHGTGRPRHAEGARGLPGRGSRRPSRCRSASTPPSPSRAASAWATPSARSNQQAAQKIPLLAGRRVVPRGLQVGRSGIQWGTVDHAARRT